MAFDEIKERVSSSASKAPASIRLRRCKGGKPRCTIGLRQVLIEQMKWTRSDCSISLLIGTDADAGKIRLRMVDKGKGIAPVRFLKKSSAVVDLGFVEAFGLVPKVGVGVDAKMIDEITVEITLPKWDEVDNDEEPSDEEPEPAPRQEQRAETKRFVAPAEPRPPVRNGNGVSAAKPKAELASVEKLGVTVSFWPRSMILRDGDGIDVTDRQALMLAPLVRSLGSVVLTADLINKMDLPASGGASVISDEFAAIAPKLAGLSLKMRQVPKMGYSLSKE